MELQHINAKIFVDGELRVPLDRFIPVFHRWVAERAMDEMLIDVADYQHVPAGPGIVLVGLEADYSMDNTGNRFGLRYNRKAPLEGSNDDRFLQAVQTAAKVCGLLEAEFSDLKFSRREFELFANDRALAPNTPESREQFRAALSSFVERVLGQRDFEVTLPTDQRALVGGVVQLALDLELASVAMS